MVLIAVPARSGRQVRLTIISGAEDGGGFSSHGRSGQSWRRCLRCSPIPICEDPQLARAAPHRASQRSGRATGRSDAACPEPVAEYCRPPSCSGTARNSGRQPFRAGSTANGPSPGRRLARILPPARPANAGQIGLAIFALKNQGWRTRYDSNVRPLPSEGSALSS